MKFKDALDEIMMEKELNKKLTIIIFIAAIFHIGYFMIDDFKYLLLGLFITNIIIFTKFLMDLTTSDGPNIPNRRYQASHYNRILILISINYIIFLI